MDGRHADGILLCEVVNGRDIPAGSSDFQLVMHQLHIHDSWRDAADRSLARKEDMEVHKGKHDRHCESRHKHKDDRNCETLTKHKENTNCERTRERTNSFTKLKRFLNINPKPQSPNHTDRHKHGRVSPGRTSPNPLSPHSPPVSSPLSPALRRAQLQVHEEQFRGRAHSDSSAMNPRKKRATLAVEEQTSPLDHLHVHWPDERQGEQLCTLLRPRSYSHGSGERPARPILKKSASRTVYY